MAHTFQRETPTRASRSETRDPFSEQIRLSRVHTRLVPMQRKGVGYAIDPAALDWFELPASRGFAGYGLGRALGLLLDAMRGLSALNETVTASGAAFVHGEFTPSQLRVDPLGVCRLVPLTARHYLSDDVQPPRAALGFLSPERLIGEQVGMRADVFSAGILLWEALAGRRLTELESADLVIDRLMSQRLRVPALPPQLAWATPLKVEVERALSVNEKRRFADCAEFSEVILRIAQDRVASQAEIAAFFASKFSTAPSPEPSSAARSSVAPRAVPVSSERADANRGATFRMLPAVSLATPTPNSGTAASGAQRHATLKMNVTLKMAQVPLPISANAPAAPALLPLAPTPPPRRSSRPPPLPLPASMPVAPLLPPEPEPEPCSEPPTTALSSAQDLARATPVPTGPFLPEPAPPSALPSTTVQPPSVPRRLPPGRLWPLAIVIAIALIISAIVGARFKAGRAAPRVLQTRTAPSLALPDDRNSGI